MKESYLIECCCICGLVLRDDLAPLLNNNSSPASKVHYHWGFGIAEHVIELKFLREGTTTFQPLILHKTVCAEHLWVGGTPGMSWSAALIALELTPERYRNGGYNLALTEIDEATASTLEIAYAGQVPYLIRVIQLRIGRLLSNPNYVRSDQCDQVTCNTPSHPTAQGSTTNGENHFPTENVATSRDKDN